MERKGFSERLRWALNDQGMSVNELGRRLRPDDPKVGKRIVRRYLSPTGAKPRAGRRQELAVLLGLEADALDDEDADLFAALVDQLEQLQARMVA